MSGRPRIRLQTPAIIFKLSASLQAPPQTGNSNLADLCLSSGVPLLLNLLQPLQEDASLKGLTAQRSGLWKSSTSIPLTRPVRSDGLPLKAIARRPFRAVPAISAKMRFHPAHSVSGAWSLTASLEIDIPGFAQSAIHLNLVDVRFADGFDQDVLPKRFMKLPVVCQPRDNIVFIYHLANSCELAETEAMAPPPRLLDIVVDAVVAFSATCRPRIELRWGTNVEFPVAYNSIYGRPNSSTQRANRSIGFSNSSASGGKASILHLNSTSSAKASLESTSTISRTEMGITVTFTAVGNVVVGHPFHWDVFIINRSDKVRKLAMAVIPEGLNWEKKTHSSRPPSSTSIVGKNKSTAARLFCY